MFNDRKQQLMAQRDLLAREVAERSVENTLEQIGDTAVNMSPAELRGYVRAYAFPFVHEEVAQLVSLEWPRKAFNALAAAALDQAVHLVAMQLKSRPVAAMPVPHVRLRIAA
jgi:hypothetical protein